MSDDLSSFAELSQFEIDPATVQLLGYGYCTKKHVVVLGRIDPQGHDAVTVGMLQPGDQQLVDSLRGFLHRPVTPVQLNAWEIQRALDIGHGKLDPNADPGRLVLPEDAGLDYAPDNPAPALATQLLSRALSLGARQIHIERYADDVDVRLRVDGGLHQLGTPLAPDNVGAVVGYLAALARLPDSAAGPRRGLIRASVGNEAGGSCVDLHLAILPGPYGDDATLHVTHTHPQPRPLEQLGLAPPQLASLRARLDAAQGLVVVGAASGHGRTTMLYSILSSLDTRRRKVMTVEPVMELDIAKIPQRTPTDDASLAELVRASLEHGPDVLAVGEVANDTVAESVRVALQRGVLVIAVVESADAVGAIATLRRLGLTDTELADHLVAVVSPRLLPRLCPRCRAPDPDDPRAAAAARAGHPVAGFAAPGCQACGGRGHDGRVGVHELLTPDPGFREKLATGATATELRQTSDSDESVVELALSLANAGEVDLATVAGLPGAADYFSA